MKLTKGHEEILIDFIVLLKFSVEIFYFFLIKLYFSFIDPAKFRKKHPFEGLQESISVTNQTRSCLLFIDNRYEYSTSQPYQWCNG
jgi:hypothetical protein